MIAGPFREILEFLYGGPAAGEILPRLSSLLKGFSGGVRKKPERPPFSHRDAFLISYGDMLSGAPDETGLRRLFRFLEKRNGGSFSFLHILPFHSYTSDDGFSVVNYREVDPRFGSWDDLARLSTLGAGNGGKVRPVFDLVINHGSVQSPWFQGFLSGDPRYEKWYLTRPEDYDYGGVVRPRTHPLLTAFTRNAGGREETVHVWTTFSSDQVDYDFSNPEVLLEFVAILLEYAGRGAGIVRLDAIAYLWKEDGTPCLHHPKTHAVVKLFRAVVDYLGLDLIVLTETNVPHTDNVSYFGSHVGSPALDGLPEASMVYNFALPPLCLHAAVSGDAAPLRAWAKTLPGPEANRYFLNFLASHDGVGLTPAQGLVGEQAFAATIEEARRRGALVSYKSTPRGEIPYELNCSYASIVAPPGAGWARGAGGTAFRARAFLAVHGVLFSLSGLPAVYFHSWTGAEAWTEGPALLGYNRAINRAKPDIEKVERELDDPASFRFHVYRGLHKMIAFRQGEDAFDPDREQLVLDAEGGVFALLRRPLSGAGRALMCLVNLSPERAVWKAPPEFPLECKIVNLEAWETLWISFDGSCVVSRFSTVKET